MMIDPNQLTLLEAEEQFEVQPNPKTALVLAQVSERLWLADQITGSVHMSVLTNCTPFMVGLAPPNAEKSNA